MRAVWGAAIIKSTCLEQELLGNLVLFLHTEDAHLPVSALHVGIMTFVQDQHVLY